MKLLNTLLLTAVLASSAIAGPIASKNPKAPVMPAPTCECFAPGGAFGLFGGAALDNGRNIADSLGGGLLAEYFFTENVGVQVSYGAYATNDTLHNADASLVLRAPIKSLCLAPYIMGGGGYVSGPDEGTFHAGGGLDFRLPNCMGIFADGAYHWANNSGDYTIVRLGVKFPF